MLWWKGQKLNLKDTLLLYFKWPANPAACACKKEGMVPQERPVEMSCFVQVHQEMEKENTKCKRMGVREKLPA